MAFDKRSLEALSKSPNGEVVLPMEKKKKMTVSDPLKVGEFVILDGVLSQRYPRWLRHC